MQRTRHLAVMAAFALLLAGLPRIAMTMCIGGDQVFYEVEIESCEPTRPRAEELIAESCRDEIASSLTLNAQAAEFDKSKGSSGMALFHRRFAKGALERADSLAEKFRKQSANLALATTRILRILRRRNIKDEGAWEAPDARAEREILIYLPSDPEVCTRLADKPVILEIFTPCCDFNPQEGLVCILGLKIGHVRSSTTPAPIPNE